MEEHYYILCHFMLDRPRGFRLRIHASNQCKTVMSKVYLLAMMRMYKDINVSRTKKLYT